MKKSKRFISVVLALVMILSAFAVIGTISFSAKENVKDEVITTGKSASDFSWDNASVYFLLTDRFVNGNKSNDHSYSRLIDKNGSDARPKLNSDVATFHGGDFAGITQKINEGYFDDLGVNAIWMSAPYEQIHGYVIVNEGKSNSIKHYAYHGYYAMDYTQTDANFGTAAEFKTLVDTAHKHGIRVVLDIVMNHPGYNTIWDMNEFGFGAVKNNYTMSQLMDFYYDWTFNGHYHEGIDYNGSGAYNKGWNNWWGKDWLRCGIDGHTPFGGDDKTKSAGGDLPDFKTESSSTVNVPTFLQNKWKKEGRYDKEMSKLNTYFNSGKSKTVRNYLVRWLSQWVEDYGVDGFRCDTAKHVELESWKALKDQCNASLKKWRQNNPTNVAASWTDNFWMTAEDYGSGVNYDNYYSQGGFDSKINFSFTGGGGVPNSGNINNTYNDYANKINTKDGFNVLTYISSHDTALCRNDLYYQGSAFQLLPGAIQIFYGDETSRPILNSTVGNEGDHLVRSDMNWNSMDKNVLAHWQKVGKFRSNHVAVGAGSHAKVDSNSGVAFSRIYNKNGVSDKVVACIAANNNADVKIKVSTCFSDGQKVRNAYDNKTAIVSGGYVTFNSGAHGTILIESTGDAPQPTTQSTTEPTVAPTKPTTTQPTKPTTTQPTITPTKPTTTQPTITPTKPTTTEFTIMPYPPTEPVGKKLYLGDVDINGKVEIIDATDIQLYLAKMILFSNTQKLCANITGKGVEITSTTYIQQYLARMPIPYEIGKEITDAPTEYSQVTTSPDPDKNTLYVDMGYECDAHAYYWIGEGGPIQWPGESMTHVSGNIYSIKVDKQYDKIIFNNGSNDQTGDLDIPGDNYIYNKNSNQWTKYSGTDVTDPTEPQTGNSIYVDMGYECNAYSYYWTGEGGPIQWPGEAMTHISGNVYKIVVPTNYDKIIFSNNGSEQTGDLDIPGDNYIYIKQNGSWQPYN